MNCSLTCFWMVCGLISIRAVSISMLTKEWDTMIKTCIKLESTFVTAKRTGNKVRMNKTECRKVTHTISPLYVQIFWAKHQHLPTSPKQSISPPSSFLCHYQTNPPWGRSIGFNKPQSMHLISKFQVKTVNHHYYQYTRIVDMAKIRKPSSH